MSDEDKSEEQLIEELAALRQRIAELEALDAQREQTETEELREAQEYAQKLIHSSLDMIIAVDGDRSITQFNDAAQKTFGYSLREILGKHVEILYSDPKEGLEVYEAARRTGRYTGEVTNRRKDGETFPSFVSASVLRDTKGRFMGVMGISRDITEHKQAEEALAAEKERLAVTLRSIGDGVITTDTEGDVVLVNAVAEKLIGWGEAEAVGRPLDEVFHIIDEETRERCKNPVERVLESGGIVSLTNGIVLVAKDGTERIIADNGAPIRDRDGSVIGVVLVFCDVTEKRRVEEELLRTDKLESVGILAGGIAHDFNNILTAILGSISLARIYENPEDKDRRLAEAERGCMRAKDLTQQLLTFSSGGAPIRKTASIAKILRDSAIFALRGSNVRCEFSIPDDLWHADVDAGQVNQAIHNVVINADQAMPNGGILRICAENMTIGTEHGLPLQPGAYIKVSIEDHGVGITREHLRQIFDPYFSTKQKGSGLGLAAAYSIVRKHNGHIAVESQVAVGTTLHIYFPASSEAVLAVEEEAEEKPITGEGRILVMDDEKHIRDIAAEMLSRIGYRVTTVIDGAEAMELYREAMESGDPFNAVIIDLTVPGGMGGKETIQKLKEIDPEVKAIVSSGYSNDPIMADFKRYGFRGVVAKPYRIRELIKTLHEVLAGQDTGCIP